MLCDVIGTTLISSAATIVCSIVPGTSVDEDSGDMLSCERFSICLDQIKRYCTSFFSNILLKTGKTEIGL